MKRVGAELPLPGTVSGVDDDAGPQNLD